MKLIGIVGGGSLGAAIASALIKFSGIQKQNIKISTGGSNKSRATLLDRGLLDNFCTNEEIFESSDMIILTVKPSDFSSLNYKLLNKSILISFVAGLTHESLRNSFKSDKVFRGMISAPKSIDTASAILCIDGDNKLIRSYFSYFTVKYYVINELGMSFATMFVALPSIISVLTPDEILRLKKDFLTYRNVSRGDNIPLNEIFDWAVSITPKFKSLSDAKRYVSSMRS